jgi:hypothetical protein
LRGRPLSYFAGWKQRYSLYPSTDRLVAALKNALAAYEISKRRSLSSLRSCSCEAHRTIVKFCASEMAEREKANTAIRKKQ